MISSYYTYCTTSANAQKSSISTELNALKSYESSNALSSYNDEMANINASANFQIASANAELSYLLNTYAQIKSVGYCQIDCSHAAQQTILQAESVYSGAQLKSIVIRSAEQMYLGVINSGEQLLQSIIRGRGDCERSVYDSYGVYLKAVAAAEVAQDYAKATADYTLTSAYNSAEQASRTTSETALETYLVFTDLSGRPARRNIPICSTVSPTSHRIGFCRRFSPTTVRGIPPLIFTGRFIRLSHPVRLRI